MLKLYSRCALFSTSQLIMTCVEAYDEACIGSPTLLYSRILAQADQSISNVTEL